jgi:serine/threonine protein phosphatase PrpC
MPLSARAVAAIPMRPQRSGDRLAIRVAGASARGTRERNEDFHAWVAAEGDELDAKGALLAVADGVGGARGGREAAESCVRGLLADYYATPDTWEVARSLDTVLQAMNAWVVGQGAASSDMAGMATTLSALIVRGARYYIGHVGDTRIYRLSRDGLAQLTQDHVWDRPGMRHVLRRAIGLDTHLAVDYLDGDLEEGDRLLLCSDGVWEPLGPERLRDLLAGGDDPQRAADALVDAGVRSGSGDNATAVVVHVDAVSRRGWRDSLRADLPVPKRLKPGARLDDFEVLDVLHESRATLLYRVRHASTGLTYAVKTLQPLLADDAASREGLLAEEWLAKRIVAPYFAQVVPQPAGRRQSLYYVMTYHEGPTLQTRVDRGDHFQVDELGRIGAQIAQGLSALHRLSVLHRDVKPANLLQCHDGSLRILDLGVALAGGVPYPELAGNPGTPSYMAPELFRGEPASVRSDVYAAGVTLYFLATRHYPYGEIEPFQTPRFGDPVPPTRYRPNLPVWFENLLLRAVARDAERRFETAEEFLVALERGERSPLDRPRRTPLVHDRATRWQATALALLVINLLLLYILIVR